MINSEIYRVVGLIFSRLIHLLTMSASDRYCVAIAHSPVVMNRGKRSQPRRVGTPERTNVAAIVGTTIFHGLSFCF